MDMSRRAKRRWQRSRRAGGDRPAAPPSPAFAATELDPIFEAIDRHAAAHAYWMDVVEIGSSMVSIPDDLEEEISRRGKMVDDVALDELLRTVPTTMRGVLALIDYVRDHDRDGQAWPAIPIGESHFPSHSYQHHVLGSVATAVRTIDSNGSIPSPTTLRAARQRAALALHSMGLVREGPHGRTRHQLR